MKKNFLTGLVLLLPMVLTTLIVIFTINLLTKPFVGTVATAFDYYGIFNKPFLFLNGQQVLLFSSKLVVLIGLGVVLVTVGFFANLFILKFLGRMGDYLLHRIPFINSIYKSTQDIVTSIFTQKSDGAPSFSSVVLVPFPHARTLSIGLITNASLPEGSNINDQAQVSVFVPGTPNPAMGFMIMFRQDQLRYIDIKVEDALKLIVSCGVIWPTMPTDAQQDISAK